MPQLPEISNYDRVLAEQEKSRIAKEHAALGSFGGPATVAEAIKVGNKVGVDPVKALDPEVRKLYEQTAKLSGVPIDRLVGTKTESWVSRDPLNMDLVDGNYDHLLELERKHNGEGPGFFTSLLGSFISRSGSLGKGWTTDLSRLQDEKLLTPSKVFENFGSPTNVFDSAITATEAISRLANNHDPAIYSALRKALQDTKDKFSTKLPESVASKLRPKLETMEAQRKAFDAAVFEPGQKLGKGMTNDDRWIANAVGGAFPDIVVALAAARTGGASGAATASPAASSVFRKLGSYLMKSAPEMTKQAVVMFPGMLSAEADEFQQFNPGGSRVEAVGKAATSALVQSVLEGLVNVPIIERMSRAKTITSRIMGLVLSGQMEGAEEVYQRVASQALLDDPSGSRKLTLRELWENYRGGMVAGVVFGAGALATSKESRAQVEFVRALNDPSTLKDMAPGKRAEFVAHLTQGGPISDLLIDAASFNSYFGDKAPKMAERLGVTPDDYSIASKLGGDLVVPTASYDEHIAGTEHFDPVYNMTRLQQGGPMLSEMHQTFDQQQTLETTQKLLAQLPAVDPERDIVRDQIAGMITQASRVFSERQATEIADGYARVLAVQAPRAKKTIAQLFEKHRLNISRDIHAKIETQLGEDYALTERTSGPEVGDQAAAGVPAPEAGRTSAGVSAPAGRVQGRSGNGAEAGARSVAGRVGAGVTPPPMLWHGTAATGFGALKAENLGTSAPGSMGPGLHLSAGPHVAAGYAEGNPDGMWRAAVRQNYAPFDASTETMFSPQDASSFGVDTTVAMSGSDLWFRLQAELGGADAAAEFLQSKGFDGLYYNHGGEDAWSVWKDDKLVGSRPTTTEQAQVDYARQGSRRDELTGQLKVAQSRLWQALPARVPTSKALGEINLNEKLISDFEAMLAAPETLTTVLDEVGTWPGVSLGKGSDKARANRFIEHVKGNLLWLYDKTPADIRDRAKLWYDGAQRIAQEFADNSGKTLQQAAAVIAALSPQQGWFSNIELARQAFDVLTNKQDFMWSKEMTSIAKSTPSIAKEKVALANITGKKLSELTSDYDKAVWLRTYSEAHGDKTFFITTPEGESMGKALNKAGTKPLALGWLAGFDALAKVVRVFEDSSPEAAHAAIGTANKVRNFYNNIFNPQDANYTTIDTHAAAAGLLMPLAASDNEAIYNFSGNESNAVGVRGSYGLFFEAYKRAAQERGVLPREMQSITWEAVRGLFEADQKKGMESRKVKGQDVTKSTLYWATADLWKAFKQGKATEEQTREEIIKLAGGITPPSWSGQTTKFFQQNARDFFEGQVTAESMPGGNVRSGIFPGIANATPDQLQRYHDEKMGIVLSALRDAGIAVDRTQLGHGYWDSETNPVTAFVIRVSDEAQLNEAAGIAADVMNDQDAVAWNAKPDPNAPVAEHNAVLVDLSRDLTSREVLVLGDALAASGLPVFPDASNPASIRIIAYDFEASPATAAQLHSNIEDIIASVLPADVTYEAGSYKATSNLVNRGAFDEAAQQGSQSVQGRAVARGRQAVEALNARYAVQNGWGDAGVGAGRGDVPVFRSRKGGPDAVRAHGVHYGTASGLTALDGSFYGQGSPGRERQRLSTEPKDSPLLKRSYAYATEDGELPAKERVVKGDIPYEFVAENLYDLEADPAGIRTAHPGDGNAIEHAIIRAGYDGYISPAADVPGRAIVMLGHDTVPVRPHGGKLDITNETGGVTRVAQSAYHGSPYKFDQFTLDHIGKGEGHQAYGWGLYFAGDQGVARWYHEQLAKTTQAHNTIDGKRITKGLLDKLKKDANPYVKDFFSHSEGVHGAGIRNITKGLDGVIEESQENADHFRQREQDLKNPNIVSATYTSESMAKQAVFYENKVAALKALKERLGYNKASKGGQLYKVDVPEDGVLLDQNKSLADQSPAVKTALETVWSDINGADTDPDTGEKLFDIEGRHGGTFGWTVYQQLSKALGGDKAASLALDAAGVKGMKYLDGNSRAQAQGYGQKNANYNYVIFDAEAVKTLETYYAGGTTGQRGYLEFPTNPKTGEPRRFDLVLLENEDKSTVFHELGHFYLELLGDMAEDPESDQSVKDDYATILKWFGVENRSQITTPMHEKFADGHLVYLLEGKPPVPEIQSAFRNFSKWLSKLAAQLSNKGQSMLGVKVDMTDEVRGVFDRLYASEQEIEEASKDLTKMFATAEQAGMSRAEFEVYSKSVAREVESAKERLTAKLMRQLEREQKSEYKTKLAEVTSTVEAEVNTRPEYAALLAITSGKLADGETEVPKLSRDWLVQTYGKDILTRLGTEGIKLVYGAEGADGDALATHLNLFDGSGDALVQALTDLPSRRETIKAQSKQVMQATHPDLLMDPAALREAALEILMGEGREKILSVELSALRKKQAAARPAVAQARQDEVQKARAAAQDRQALTEEQQRISADNARAEREQIKEASTFAKVQSFRLAASAHISRQQAWTLRPDRYLSDQRRNAAASYKAALKGDYEKAAGLKEQEILSHFLYKEALAAKHATEAFRAWVKRNDSATVRGKMGKAGGTYLAQFDALRDQFGIEREPNKVIENRLSLGAWVEKMVADAKDPVIAEWILDETNRRNYRQLTVAEMRDLHNGMKNIKHLAYQELGTIIDGKRVEYETMHAELAAAAEANLTHKPVLSSGDVRRKSGWFKTASMLQGLDATLVKMEQMINWIDGGDVNGPAHRYIWNRVAKAQHEDYKLTMELNKVIIDAFDAMPKEYRNSMDETFEIGMDHPVSRNEILTMLLYNGQQTRFQKLMEGNAGMGLNGETMARAFSKLKAEDFQLATAIWKSFDHMKPMVLDMEERLTGIRPEWEGNRSFEVYGEDGQLLAKLEGGYFPLVADPALTGELGRKQEGGTVQQILTSNGYSRATTSTGHTKELTGATYPLLLDWHRIVTSELSNQIKDLTHREVVLSINKILQNDGFTKIMRERLGAGYEDQFMPWLTNIANDRNAGAAAGMSGPNKLMSTVRANTVAAVLGFKYSSMVVQLADFARVLTPGPYSVSPAALGRAMHTLATNNTATVEMIKELSPEMAERKRNLDRDLRGRLDQLAGQAGWTAAAQRKGFAGLAFMDAFVSWPTWLAAYQTKVKEHGDQERAAKEADRTVRMLLQTGAPKDLTTMLSKNEQAWKLITMFMGDATANYNALRNAGHNINGLKGIPTFTMALFGVMLANILGDLIKGHWPEDKEDPALWALRKAALAPFGTAPVVRDAANVADNVFAGKPFTDWRFSPAITTLQKTVNGVTVYPKRLLDGKDTTSDFIINEMEAAGYAFGIPGTAQATGSTKYFKRYLEGEENPTNPIQFGNDLITGKKKEKR